jgi:hypothetical protein
MLMPVHRQALRRCLQALRYSLLFISTAFVLTFFTRCNSSTATDRSIENAALNLADNIDSSSLNLLRKFCFGKRGKLEFWQRVSADSFRYTFSYRLSGDTTELTLFRPYGFASDFTTNYRFDTAKYYQFKFSKVNNTIVKIAAVTNQAGEISSDTSISTKQLFPDQNPFATLATLTGIKDRYSFVGSSYRGDIGDFIVFWLTPQYKLTYLPDSLKVNEKFRKYWLDDFSKGKIIKQHWSLQKVYDR